MKLAFHLMNYYVQAIFGASTSSTCFVGYYSGEYKGVVYNTFIVVHAQLARSPFLDWLSQRFNPK